VTAPVGQPGGDPRSLGAGHALPSRATRRHAGRRQAAATVIATDAVTLLSRTRLFGAVPAKALSQVAERSQFRGYRKGELIVRQGDSGETLFVVVEGLVKVFVTSPDGAEMVLVTLGPTDTFGELAVVDGGERSASAEACDATTLLVLRRSALLALLPDHPDLAEGLLRSLGALARRLTDQTADLVFLDLHGRVAKLLVGLAEERGETRDGTRVLDLHLTQSDLASMVGGSRQSINQILRTFEALGYLGLDGRRMLVLRPDMLRHRAGLPEMSGI
jgi:CRP/FNR family cyclic AMP-dependent transcriptional regulator